MIEFFVLTIAGAVIVYFAAKAIDARLDRAKESETSDPPIVIKSEGEPFAVTRSVKGDPSTPHAPGFGNAVFLTILVAGIYYFFYYSPGFTDAEIQRAKESIRTELGKHDNVTIESIDLMRARNDAGKLIGVVKLKFGDFPISKSCSATLGENRAVFWECK